MNRGIKVGLTALGVLVSALGYVIAGAIGAGSGRKKKM